MIYQRPIHSETSVRHQYMHFYHRQKTMTFLLETICILNHEVTCTLNMYIVRESCEWRLSFMDYLSTHRGFNGHIPAERRMEYLVKEVKEHSKHMFSNKTERNVRNRSSSISSIREIAEHYEEMSGCRRSPTWTFSWNTSIIVNKN